MIDINLLRLSRVKSDYMKIKGAVDNAALDPRTKKVMFAIGKYFDKHPTHEQIDFTVFLPFVERNTFRNLDADEMQVYSGIITNMAKQYPDHDTRKSTLSDISELNLMQQVRTTTEAYNDGEDLSAAEEISEAMDTYKLSVGAAEVQEISENIDSFLDAVDNDDGVHWRLKCLNRAMRPLRGGDFGILAARPDQGKTSFLCSELTYMAAQLPDNEIVLWLNNEGPGYVIQPRLMQSALNCTLDELVVKRAAGTLYDEYHKAISGTNKIKIVDIHGWNTYKVESLIESTRPSILVYDMIDNIYGFASEARTDLALEKMYQWARERAVKYDCIALATSQISSAGIDERYPGLGMLKDSKTGKQGACEFMIMIGSMENDETLVNHRWISAPKNKLRRIQSKRLQEQVIFDKDRARYRDIEAETKL